MDTASKFHQISRQDRLSKLLEQNIITLEEYELLLTGVTEVYNQQADSFIENTIGCFPLPLGVVPSCIINNTSRCVPLVVEETSIIAGLNKTAKLFNQNQGVMASQLSIGNIGQLYLGEVVDIELVKAKIVKAEASLLAQLNQTVFRGLVNRGGGAKRLDFRELVTQQVVLHLVVDTCDAMGANLINMGLEQLKPVIETLLGVQVGVCIISNLVDTQLTQAQIKIDSLELSVMEKIVSLSEFAQLDLYRAATHNKGVMNAIDGVLIATGNDWRAVEAGIHTYAQGKGITTWKIVDNKLVGTLVAPIIVGVVGGVTKIHPLAKMALRMLQVDTAIELAMVLAAVGLMQNFAALHALSTEGIVKGHMRLHIDNLVLAAGVTQQQQVVLKAELVKLLIKNNRVTKTDVTDILAKWGL